MGASGYVRSKPEPKLLDGNPSPISLLAWRQHIADTLGQLLADSPSLRQ